MMLGDVLAAARRSGSDMRDWLEPSDPALWAALSVAARREESDPASFARAAVAEFSERAAEEDWSTLISQMRNADDPGRASMLKMIRWRLRTLTGASRR